MLILQKTGVVSVGIKLVGLGAGAAGAGAAAGPLTAAGAAIAGGILLGIRHALAAGWKTAVSELPKLLEGVGSILNFSASGWANAILDHFSKPVRQMWAALGHFLASSFDITRHQVARAWDLMASDIASAFDIAGQHIRIVWDKIKILFLQGEDFIVRTMAKLPGPFGAPFRAAHLSIRTSLDQIKGDVAAATRHIQADWDRIHGKTVRVNFVGSGSGSIAFKQSIPGVTTGPSSQGILGFHAEGGRITGGTPGRDSVLGMLMPGEVVVPTQMVNAGAVDHLRGQLPGFAAGGAVTGMGASDRIPAAGVPFMANAEARFGRAVEGAFARAAIAKFKKDAAARPGAGPASRSAPWVTPGHGRAARRWRRRSPGPSCPSITGARTSGRPGSTSDNQESGWNAYAVNPSSGAYGIGQSLGHGHPLQPGRLQDPGHLDGATTSGTGWATATRPGHGRTSRPYNWYAKGGLVPGYASGGTVAKQGRTWLNAWRSPGTAAGPTPPTAPSSSTSRSPGCPPRSAGRRPSPARAACPAASTGSGRTPPPGRRSTSPCCARN